MIAEYARLLLPLWLRPGEGSDLGKLIDAVADAVTVAHSAVGELRRQGIAATANGQALDRIGESRNMLRWDDESNEGYRKRLLATFATRMRAATPAGMVAMMASFGHPEAGVIEFGLLGPTVYLDGGKNLDGSWTLGGKPRWAEFAILIDLAPDVSSRTVARWISEIKRAKPAHTKLAYLGMAHEMTDNALVGQESEGITATSVFQAYLDGTWSLDGSTPLGPVEEVFYA